MSTGCKVVNGRVELPAKVEKALEVLTKALKGITPRDDQMYCTGGFVRDLLLGLEFSDIDLMIQDDLFDKYVLLVKSLPEVYGFGTDLTAGAEILNQIELIRFKIDGFDFDLKRSKFQSDLKRDVLLRDFTINSLYINPITRELIDPENYLEDLFSKTLRGVQKYSITFIDRNRIIRTVRFMYKGFSLEPELQKYMKTGAIDYMREANDVVDLQRFGGEIRKCIACKDYYHIIEDLIEGELLAFLCKDKSVLFGMLDTIELVKDLLGLPMFKEASLKPGFDLENEEMMLILHGIVLYFLAQYEQRVIKKAVVRKACMMFFKKSKVEETIDLKKKLQKIAKAGSFKDQQKLVVKFRDDAQKRGEGSLQLLLLSMFIDFKLFLDLIV